MSREIGLWRVDGTPERVTPKRIDLESTLEAIIENDPLMLDDPVMIIGRQVPTAHGKFIDLLGIDADGTIHVLELKRDRTPRDVVAQLLDYGSWVKDLSHDDVLTIFNNHARAGVSFETAFAERFGANPPEELNEGHTLTIVASEVDPATERIVDYLVDYGLPINVMFFRYFEDGPSKYLARTWLVDDTRVSSISKSKQRTKETWNGVDWYVSFGLDSNSRSWDDARKYGFVSAGGGKWFTRTIRGLEIGARVWVCVPKSGYVGVGEVIGEAMPFPNATVDLDGEAVQLSSLDLHAVYDHGSTAPDDLEYVVRVKWIKTVGVEDAVWEQGMFANQNSACKLRNRFTLDRLVPAFGVAATED
ncbi:endonuclease NucS domain-containing protein [Ilumatobacter coccineus]|uniref:Endonuclease NucS C-terminal domain-containing protein n=1 Tax=Ilumatobacter coccineus (strain NBRC 103263 / KCTC 29153 / YM16-304) TaxID=1313172 RepID=A0A6C7EDD8_ILUCY|nr:endonuclease NucS domain-containing protein [Ilumatobacter coccineus]BAN04380.1 hypothetical protein YM304_40660 [Ilumatobacter coccineus YM16-304]